MKNINTFKISKATAAEICELVAIEKECCLECWTADDYRKELARETSLILTAKYKTEERGSEIKGFIASRFAALKTLSDKTERYAELDILNFGVLKKYRRQGIGSLLLNGLLERASVMRVESIWLEVRESNSEALNLYQKKGFSLIRMRKNFYTQPSENALVLKLDAKNLRFEV